MHGITKKIPGPFAPPGLSLPSLKMTALSYSWTTFIQRKREAGRVTITSNMDSRANSEAQTPGLAGSAEMKTRY